MNIKLSLLSILVSIGLFLGFPLKTDAMLTPFGGDMDYNKIGFGIPVEEFSQDESVTNLADISKEEIFNFFYQLEEILGVDFTYEEDAIFMSEKMLYLPTGPEGQAFMMEFCDKMAELLLEVFPEVFKPVVKDGHPEKALSGVILDELTAQIRDDSSQQINLVEVLQRTFKYAALRAEEQSKLEDESEVVNYLESLFPEVDIRDPNDVLSVNDRYKIIEEFLTLIKEKCPQYLELIPVIEIAGNSPTWFAHAGLGIEGIVIFGEDFFEADDEIWGPATPERGVQILLHELGHKVEGTLSEKARDEWRALTNERGAKGLSELFAEDFRNIIYTGQASLVVNINGELVDVSDNAKEREEFFYKYVLPNLAPSN